MDKERRLIDALEHILKVAEKSRTQTRRLRWIQERAKSALNGDDKWRDIDLPKISGATERERVLMKKLKYLEINEQEGN